MFNKQDLIETVYASHNVETKVAAERVVNAVLGAISVEVCKGNKVSLAGFGIFTRKAVKARVGRNPMTGAKVKIAPHNKVKFLPAKSLKEAVNEK